MNEAICRNTACSKYRTQWRNHCALVGVGIRSCPDFEDGGEIDDHQVLKPAESESQRFIREECQHIMTVLLNKNRKYGDSAIHPKRIFSKADPIEAINVRLDDKISRLISGQVDEDEDVDLDIIGYLVLRRVAKRVHGAKRLEDGL